MTHLQSLLTGQAKNFVKDYGCNEQCNHQASAELKKKYGEVSFVVNAYLGKLASFQSPSAQKAEKFDNFFIFINDVLNDFTRLDYKHDLKSAINTQVALQKLSYSQLVDRSKHCEQNQIKSASLKQFVELFSLTADTFENFKPFFKNKLTKNGATIPGCNRSHYGHAQSRYAEYPLQGT